MGRDCGRLLLTQVSIADWKVGGGLGERTKLSHLGVAMRYELNQLLAVLAARPCVRRIGALLPLLVL